MPDLLNGLADIFATVKLGGVSAFNSDLDAINKKVEHGGKAMQGAINLGIAAGAAAFGAAALNAANFEKALANVNTIVGLDKGGLQKIGEDVKAIAVNMPTDMASLTGGLYDLVSSGVPAANATSALAAAAQAASAGLTGVDTAVRAGMANINSYGLPISELTRVFDLQFQAVNVGVLSYEQLATSIGNALPAAQNLKVPLEELYASVAQLTLSGIDPQSSTTYLGRLFTQLADPDITGKIEANGIKVWGPDGSFRGLVAVLKDMDAAVKGMSTEQKANFFNSMGFTEQSNKAMLALVGNLNGENGFLSTMEKMAGSPGAVSRAFKEQNDTLSAQAAIFKNIVQVSFIDLGNAFLPILRSITELASQNPEATKTLAASVGTLAIGFAGIAAAYKGVGALRAMFLALSASPIGGLAIAIAGVAAGIVAINTAVAAHDAEVLKSIGATSEDIDKVGQLADAVEALRGKKELTKDETVSLHDAEKQLGEMLGSVGLNIEDYKGKLDEVKGAYDAVREAQLLWDLQQLEDSFGKDGGIIASIGAGLTAISPALGNLVTDTAVNRTGEMGDRIKAIKDELAEIEKNRNAVTVKEGIDAIGNAAAGADGKGGAAAKIKLTKEELKALKEAAERENFKEVKGMTGFSYLDEIQNKAMLSSQQVRGLAEAIADKQTGLVGKFPEVETGAKNAAFQVGAFEGAMYALSTGLNTWNPKVGQLVDHVWKIGNDGKLDKSEIPGLLRSIGTAAGEANTKVGGLMNLMAGFVESGFSPISLALGGLTWLLGDNKDKADQAVTSWEGVEKILGTTGTAMGTLAEQLKAVNEELELDVLTAMEAKMEGLAFNIATKTAEYDKLKAAGDTGNQSAKKSAENLKELIAQMQGQYDALADKAEEYTAAFSLDEKYKQTSGAIQTLTDKYKDLSERFGDSANLEGLKELLGQTVTESDAMLKSLTPNTTAFEELNKKIEAARGLLQGLVSDVQAVNTNPVVVPIVMSPTGAVTAGPTATLHGGGFPVAHDGYLSPDETFVKMLKNEMVLRPAATAKFGAARLLDFNATLDPAVLAGQGGSRYGGGVVINVQAIEATPATYFKISDRYMQPRMNQRSRRFEVEENPYAK